MHNHKYKVGQTVIFCPSSRRLVPLASDRDASKENYEIMQLLPATGSVFQYRIKGGAKGHERVVIEHEIESADYA